MSNTYHYRSPAALGINEVDMKADAETDYDSGVINGTGEFAFQALVNITVAGGSPSAGACSLNLVLLANDESTELAVIPLATAISTVTTAKQALVVFGGGVTGAIAASPFIGTVGTNIDKVKVIGPFLLRLTVDTAGVGGTTHTASVHLMSEGN